MKNFLVLGSINFPSPHGKENWFANLKWICRNSKSIIQIPNHDCRGSGLAKDKETGLGLVVLAVTTTPGLDCDDRLGEFIDFDVAFSELRNLMQIVTMKAMVFFRFGLNMD